MPYHHRTALLVLSIFSSLLAVDSSQQNNIPNSPINIASLDNSDIPETIHNIINNHQHHHHYEQHHHYYPQQQPAQPITQQPPFDDLETKELEFIFISSPKEAQWIVNHLQDPSYFPLNQDYRFAIFVGDPGTGKTAMARAIASKMVQYNWEYRFLPSTSFLKEHRNQTAIQLQQEFETIKKSKTPTILIIDELNLLMENTESKHHDTDTTATTLWTFLDEQKGNKDFFFIGTMNRANKLPKAFKSRIILNCIKFPLVSNPIFKTDFIRRNLTTKTTKLDTEVTNEFLDQELKKMGNCSERDLKNLLLTICRTSKMTSPTSPYPIIIKKVVITAAIDQYIKNKFELDYNFEEETDDQRQNRHHQENINMHEKHFAQQQLTQIILNYENNPLISLKDTIHNREGYISSLLTDEQLKLCKNIATNAQTKKT